MTAYKTCNLCEAMCGLLIETADGPEGPGTRVAGIRPDPDDPLSRGHICPKAFALKELQEDPDRLRQPVRRVDGGNGEPTWQEISWDEALDEVATRLAEVQLRDGDDAVGTYLGNPGAHNFGTVATITLLRQALASRNTYTASSVDQNPKHASSLFLFGNVFSIPIPDIDRTDFLLMFGANPVVSNGSLMSAPGFRRRARALQARGGRLVVVDPRRTETAALADEHWFLRPGMDALLLAALVHVVLDEKLGRAPHFSDQIDGGAALAGMVAPFAPEAVEAALGIGADRVRRLAREFANAPSAVCYGRVGTALQPFATLANWLVDVMNIVTGNLDRAGGAMFPTPAVDLAGLIELRGGSEPAFGAPTRVRGAPAFNGEWPAACIAEEITTPGPGRMRAMLTIAGNPVLSTPNGRALDAALEGLDYFASIDCYRNETTRHANVILPPTTTLEHDNYEIVFHGFAVRNTAKYSSQVLPKPAGALDEWEILVELALRIREKKAARAPVRLAWRTLRAAMRRVHPRQILDAMLRIGPHGDGFRPWRRGLRLRDLEAAPQGVDLGALVPSLPRVLHTQSGRIDIAHPVMVGELRRLASELPRLAEGSDGDTLLLIGRRDPRTNNSWLHNVPLAVAGRDRCTLWMHPDDAAKRALEAGARASVESRVGRVEATVEVTEDLMPGVVCLPHGWGHHRAGMALRNASAHAGVSINDVTDDRVLEPVVGNAVLNGVPVTVALSSTEASGGR